MHAQEPTDNGNLAPQLVELKTCVDEAGRAFRDTKRQCFEANFQYFRQVQIGRLQPLALLAAQITPERRRALDAQSAAAAEHYDRARAAARCELDAARTNLNQAVAAYRTAKAARESHGQSES